MTTGDSPLKLNTDGRAKPITAAETLLLAAVKTGDTVTFPGAPKPGEADGWTDQHTIRATFLRHLCLHPALYAIAPKGVQLHGARITDALDFEAAALTHPLWVFDSRFEGKIIFRDAQTRSLGFVDCHLTGFRADRLTATGTLKLAGSTVMGETSLLGAVISGNLECDGATFTHKGNDAFSADGLKTGGAVFFRNTTVTGATRLLGADITGNLECDGATFSHEGDIAFIAQRLVVGGRFFWRKLAGPPKGDINLNHAQVGDFVDDGSGWPDIGKGHLVLDGFCYETIGPDTTATTRKQWLARMPTTQDGNPDENPAFWPQPYEQLIKVLRAAGHDADARRIAIAKRDDYRKHLRLRAMRMEEETTHYIPGEGHYRERLGLLLAKYTVGYGYWPWLPLMWIGGIIVLGAFIYGGADNAEYMHVAKERVYMDGTYKQTHQLPAEYPPFNALVFSIDTMIPFVDLHQEAYWE
ncbi:MAG TPA: hypothetical protein VIN57_02060, partial [Magnetovibrio sp.]